MPIVVSSSNETSASMERDRNPAMLSSVEPGTVIVVGTSTKEGHKLSIGRPVKVFFAQGQRERNLQNDEVGLSTQQLWSVGSLY